MTQDARTRILDACERTIAESGLRGFRMSTVAREAGVSIGLLAYHFGDRDGLLQAALDRVNEGTTSRAAHAIARESGATPIAELEALLCSEFGDAPHVRAGSIVWNELRAAAVFTPGQAKALSHSTSVWQGAVEQLTAQIVPPQEAAMTALLLTSLVEGLSGRWLTGQITTDQATHAVSAALAKLARTTPNT